MDIDNLLKTQKMIKVAPHGTGPWLIETPESAGDIFKHADVGEIFEVEIIEMNPEDIKKLPEFGGW